MNNSNDASVVVFADEARDTDFAVSLNDLLRCVRIADERFLIPPVAQKEE